MPPFSSYNAGGFRSDLFYRLASIPIVMPTPRERLEAIDAAEQQFERTPFKSARENRFGRRILRRALRSAQPTPHTNTL